MKEELTFNLFKNKTKFNSNRKEVFVEIYLSRQNEETSQILILNTTMMMA